MSNLTEHTKKELELAGFFDKDSDYDGGIGGSVLELIEVFAKQGHSGSSAMRTLQVFNMVVKFENLTPLGTTEDEWMDCGDGLWQNKRNSVMFSRDKGKTWKAV